jgi:putative DNA primase/helicase
MAATRNRPSVDGAASEEFGGSELNVNAMDRSSHSNSEPARALSLVPAQFSPTSGETLVNRAVEKYLESIDGDPTLSLTTIRDELLRRINGEIALENSARKSAFSTSPVLTKQQVLDEMTVATVLLNRHHIVAVDLSEGNADDMTMLAVYIDSGEDEGVHSTSQDHIKALASELKPSMTSRAIDSLYSRLRIHAPVVFRTTESHLIPVRNGVFDHTRQVLRSFSPD